MAMENNDLNNKIMRNVRTRIVVSNLEKEETIEKTKRRHIISLCATTIILLSGSFFSVNAATDGKLVEDIKEKYKEIITIDYDQSKYKITETKEEKLPTGQNTVSYRMTSIDGQEEMDTVIMTDELDKSDLKIKDNVKEENGEVVRELVIEDK